MTSVESSILKKDLTRYFPILIDKNNYILDGQHRFHVCKKHKMPVYFIKADDIDINVDTEILIKCNIQEKQTVSDLIKMLKHKDKELAKAIRFSEKYPEFPQTSIIELLFASASTSFFKNALENGKYKIRFEEELIQIIEYINSLNVSSTVDKYSRSFLIAIARVFYKSHKDLIMLKKKENLIKSHKGYNNYLNHFMFILGNYEKVYG